MKVFKIILFSICAFALLAGIFCVVVAICSAINGVSFAQQLTNWFKPAKDAVETTAQLFLK